VLENIMRIAGESELYAPDVPVFGDGLFDRAFFIEHRDELLRVRDMLSDEESVRIFEDVVRYKLTGDTKPLLRATSNEEDVMRTLVRPHEIRVAADFGSYNGDTVRQLLDRAEGSIERIYAFEPDRRNFQKLEIYAKDERRAEILPVEAGAWNEDTTLCFDASGNRNASFGSNRSLVLSDRPAKIKEIRARRPDSVIHDEHVDYMKYDVEGSEKEALEGSEGIIRTCYPRLLVSLYHRNEDLFALPLFIKEHYPQYNRFYLRRFAGVPAWDINLYCEKTEY
jgi:FkbM family methyltransferase